MTYLPFEMYHTNYWNIWNPYIHVEEALGQNHQLKKNWQHEEVAYCAIVAAVKGLIGKRLLYNIPIGAKYFYSAMIMHA